MKDEKAVNQKGKTNKRVTVIAVLLFIVLLLLFFLSPLKDIVFPAEKEPEITLVVVESAESEEKDGFYRVLVEAVVEGKPKPQLQFNRNDGIGQVEPNFTLVLLAEDETFLLTAVAVNTQGTAEASIEIFPGIAVSSASSTDSFAESPTIEPGAGDEEGEDTEGDTGVDPVGPGGNNMPDIEAIFFKGDNISDLVFRGESLPVRYEEGRHDLVVAASDDDGDPVAFDITASHGRIVDLRQVAVDSIAFSWLSPANPAGNLEPLNVSLTVIARDPLGGSDREVIGIALLSVIDEGSGGEPADSGETAPIETTLNTFAIADLSGYVTSDELVRTGVILIGDNSANKMIKGYLAFNISTLSGVHPDDIISTRVRFNHINKSGRPESFATWVDFKDFDFGSAIDARDFTVGGTLFYRQRADSFNSGITVQGSLITQVRQAVSAGKSYLKVKMGLDAGTNNNNADDLFQLRPENVLLQVVFLDYSEPAHGL